MARTSPRALKNAIATLIETELSASFDLSDITVYPYTVKEEDRPTNYLVLGDIEGNDSPHTAQGGQLSTYLLMGESRVVQPAAADAADVGWELLNAIQVVLAANHEVGNVVDAQMNSWSIDEIVDPNYGGRLVIIEFSIEVRDTNE